MTIKSQNPWGVAPDFDNQRSDLWTLDVRPIIDAVVNPTGVAFTAEYQNYAQSAASAVLTENCLVSITLPDETIDSISVIRGTQKMDMPGYDSAPSSMRIDFWHEDTGNALRTRSAIYSLLHCWQLLATAGQTKYNRNVVVLDTSYSKPVFKRDLALYLLKGGDTGSLEQAETYVMVGAWITDLQLPDLDRSASGLARVVATIQLEDIVPA